MTAKPRRRKRGTPTGDLGCDFCPKVGMNEHGLRAHVRQKHPEHREEYERTAAARKQLQTAKTEEAVKATHEHATAEGAARHVHDWGEQPHTHPGSIDAPPVYGTSIIESFPQDKSPMVATDRPVKTEEEKQREHTAALEEAQRIRAQANIPFPAVGDSEDEADIVVWVSSDGFTVLGKVWYYGEEIRVRRGSRVWKETLDANGNSWLDMDEDTQLKRYGEVKFRPGAWPGLKKAWTEDEYSQALAHADPEEARRLEKMRQRNQLPMDVPLAR